MVEFIDNRDDKSGDKSKWRKIMRSTRERFREIWSGGEKIPERDD